MYIRIAQSVVSTYIKLLQIDQHWSRLGFWDQGPDWRQTTLHNSEKVEDASTGKARECNHRPKNPQTRISECLTKRRTRSGSDPTSNPCGNAAAGGSEAKHGAGYGYHGNPHSRFSRETLNSIFLWKRACRKYMQTYNACRSNNGSDCVLTRIRINWYRICQKKKKQKKTLKKREKKNSTLYQRVTKRYNQICAHGSRYFSFTYWIFYARITYTLCISKSVRITIFNGILNTVNSIGLPICRSSLPAHFAFATLLRLSYGGNPLNNENNHESIYSNHQ